MMPKKIDQQEKTLKFQQNMLTFYDKYMKAREILAGYEGKHVDEVGLDKVNAMLADVQETFKDLHPMLNFIQSYYQWSLTTLNFHADLIDVLKKAGANEVKS
jgi:hypothetical protein